jgi:hypothetical protein
MSGERGQASVEMVAAMPALLLAGLVAMQLLAAGYALTVADGAAEAGALALAGGESAAPAVRSALPAWARDGARVRVDGGRVTVTVPPPSLIPAVGRRLTISSSATARPAR